jgi:hypothetical protein
MKVVILVILAPVMAQLLHSIAYQHNRADINIIISVSRTMDYHGAEHSIDILSAIMRVIPACSINIRSERISESAVWGNGTLRDCLLMLELNYMGSPNAYLMEHRQTTESPFVAFRANEEMCLLLDRIYCCTQ